MRYSNTLPILFICAFLFLLILPSVGIPLQIGTISDKEFEDREVRPRNRFGGYNTKQTFYQYLQNQEKALVDNIAFKTFSNYLTFSLSHKLLVSPSPNSIELGADSWYFLGNNFVNVFQAHTSLRPHYDPKALQQLYSLQLQTQQALQEKDILYFLFINPDKHTVYGEYLPFFNQVANRHLFSRDLANFSSSATNNSPVIFPEQDFLKAKAEYSLPLYYKTDSHWNNLGAYVGYRKLMQELNQRSSKYFTPIELLSYQVAPLDPPPSNFYAVRFIPPNTDTTDTNISLQLSGDDHKITWTDFTPHGVGTFNTLRNAEEYNDYFHNPNALNNATLILIRDSFCNGMLSMLQRTFSNIILIHKFRFNKTLYDALLRDFPPDAVIVSSVERDIPHLPASLFIDLQPGTASQPQ